MSDGYHHSRFLCDFLEALKETHAVTPEISQDLIDFFQATFTFINKFW